MMPGTDERRARGVRADHIHQAFKAADQVFTLTNPITGALSVPCHIGGRFA